MGEPAETGFAPREVIRLRLGDDKQPLSPGVDPIAVQAEHELADDDVFQFRLRHCFRKQPVSGKGLV